MSKQHKRGRLAREEVEFIKENASKMTVEEISKHINRMPDTVREWMVTNVGIADTLPPEQREIHIDTRKRLRYRPEWKQWVNEFVEDELAFLEYRYTQLMVQLGENTLPTEEIQLFQLIKFEILMNRNLRDRKRAVGDINKLQELLDAVHEEKPDSSSWDDKTRDYVMSLNTQLTASQAAQKSNTTEYVKLQDKYNDLMKQLKATRDQRLEKIESKKEDILSLLKYLQEREAQKFEGRQMELMKLSMEAEHDRLAELHKYADNSLDRPLLTAETVGGETDEE